MHILLVDLQFDYGMKHRGPNMIGQQGFKSCFEKLGFKVSTFYYDDYLVNPASLQSDLLRFARESKPDLIYFILFSDQFLPSTLDELKKIAITVNWFGDDQWRFDSFTAKYASHFSWSITTDPFALKKYQKQGIKNVFLSQWAAIDDNAEISQNLTYKYDVSFVGASQSYRRWFVAEIKKRGINVEAFGFNWPNGALTNDEMIKVFQLSKINLNLSNSVSYDLRYLMHNLKNPIVAWKSQKTASQVKARNFEIAYYGGFELTEYVPGLDRYFEIGKEVACYKDIDEAELLIRYYLENENERENIKRAGTIKSRSSHSYMNRHRQFFDFINYGNLKG
jgi:spore maturation protein CgeB